MGVDFLVLRTASTRQIAGCTRIQGALFHKGLTASFSHCRCFGCRNKNMQFIEYKKGFNALFSDI
jgi:hypothetical protein